MADVTTMTGIGIQVLTTSEIESTIIQDFAGSGLTTARRGTDRKAKRRGKNASNEETFASSASDSFYRYTYIYIYIFVQDACFVPNIVSTVTPTDVATRLRDT